MGINYQTIKTKEDIAKVINNSKLPAINVLFILDLLRQEVSLLVNNAVEAEKKEILENDNQRN